ncbi:Sensor histidine kinase LiaS [Bremerella volcania]|uniref:Sensor histidine kinase LiaS n=2 Tax=Bremerella volcania TaxID=2527984 RepID=A0A518C8Y2_9BACT|nr:Sensor histidine kinase LiaS [Bremerella volcania]
MNNSPLEAILLSRPVRVSFMILLVVFVAEFSIMFVLPLVLVDSQTSWKEAAVDATLLTMILIPFMWFVIIRPIQELANIRASLLEQFAALQDEERRRIAFDLHDEVGQSLTSVMMGLRALGDQPDPSSYRQRIDDLREVVNSAVHEVRRIANGLRPAALDHLGLQGALERMAEDAEQIHDIDIELTIEIQDWDKLSNPLQTTIYRIVQEGLTNVARHSGARLVRILVAQRRSEVVVEIEDDGRGFDKDSTSNQGMGVSGMIQRTALLAGEFSVLERPEGGTIIRARIPVRS